MNGRGKEDEVRPEARTRVKEDETVETGHNKRFQECHGKEEQQGKRNQPISPFSHLSIFSKRPILQPITSPPLSLLIEIFIPKLHCNLIIRKCKQFLAKSISIFPGPLMSQESNYLLGAREELVAVAPDRVGGVSFGYRFWLSV